MSEEIDLFGNIDTFIECSNKKPEVKHEIKKVNKDVPLSSGNKSATTYDFSDFRKRMEVRKEREKDLIKHNFLLAKTDKAILNDEELQNERNKQLVKLGYEAECEFLGWNDVAPEGQGEFGFCRFNPIPVNGVIGELTYLSSLVLKETNEPIVFKKVKTVCGYIDEYELMTVSRKKYKRLYFDKRYEHKSKLLPEGFIKIETLDAIRGISTPVKRFPRKNLYDLAVVDCEKYFDCNYVDVILDKFDTMTFNGWGGSYCRTRVRLLGKYNCLKRDLVEYFLLVRNHIEAMFANVNDNNLFYWIKDRALSYSFDFTAFTYKNKTYSIIIDFINANGDSTVSWGQKELQILNCEANNMIPLLFRINADSKTPCCDGWNLYHTETGIEYNPTLNDDVLIYSKSNWELFMLAQNLAFKQIEAKGYTVLNTAEDGNCLPNIRFQTPEGTVGWCNVNININNHKQSDRDLNIEDTFRFLGRASFGHCVEVYIDVDNDRRAVPRNGDYKVECSELLTVKMKGNKVMKFVDNNLF